MKPNKKTHEDKPPMDNANKPAFPLTVSAQPSYEGLTKRERFAMAAMQGMLGSENTIPGIVESLLNKNGDYEPEDVSDIIAEASVNHADALLKELEATDDN